jgi:hypothetical protein
VIREGLQSRLDGFDSRPRLQNIRLRAAGVRLQARPLFTISAPPANYGLYGGGSRSSFLHASRNALGVHWYSSLKSLLKYEELLYPTE